MGYILAIFSAVAVSLVYITSKIIQETMETPVFLFWWFCFASVWGCFSFFAALKTIQSTRVSLIIFGISLMINDGRLNLRSILNRFIKN